MRQKRLVIVATCVCLAAAAAAHAHHSFSATFDIDKPIVFKGNVSAVRWTNPHTMIDVEGPDTRGKMTKWTFESLPPGVLFRKGLTRARLKEGTPVTMTGHRARKVEFFAEVSLIAFGDGEQFCVPASGSTKVCNVEER